MKITYSTFAAIWFISNINKSLCQFGSEYPLECDIKAADACEKEFYECRLYSGPVGADTQCKCGTQFYGDCLRRANCMLYYQEYTTPHMLYMRQCVNFIIKYDCSDTMICAINCQSEGQIDRNTSNIVPFNNYGPYYLRLRLCNHDVHSQKFDRYGVLSPQPCRTIEEFNVCERWIAPNSFVPVALPQNTSYLHIDYCEIRHDGIKNCFSKNPSPSTVYGNKLLSPSSFDVPKTASSICNTDDDCLGSFCDKTVRPHICSPKSLKHVDTSNAILSHTCRISSLQAMLFCLISLIFRPNK